MVKKEKFIEMGEAEDIAKRYTRTKVGRLFNPKEITGVIVSSVDAVEGPGGIPLFLVTGRVDYTVETGRFIRKQAADWKEFQVGIHMKTGDVMTYRILEETTGEE